MDEKWLKCVKDLSAVSAKSCGFVQIRQKSIKIDGKALKIQGPMTINSFSRLKDNAERFHGCKSPRRHHL